MASARSFLRNVIDYAGLFPPTGLEMDAAVKAYAEYHRGGDADLLGRFVVPVTRLGELVSSLDRNPEASGIHWRLSCVTADAPAAADEIARFNDLQKDRAVCDTIEVPVASLEEIDRTIESMPSGIDIFLEISAHTDPHALIHEIASTRASAKIRTGGVVASAVPSSLQVLRFIEACVDEGVPFKATAGLHHLIRGEYPLTYEKNAERATMFGYLNVFLAAALCAAGSSEIAVIGALDETDPRAFRFDEKGFWWKDHFVHDDQLTVVRQNVAVSFGSCSFIEPVSEARAFHFI